MQEVNDISNVIVALGLLSIISVCLYLLLCTSAILSAAVARGGDWIFGWKVSIPFFWLPLSIILYWWIR